MTLVNQEYYLSLISDDKIGDKVAEQKWMEETKDKRLSAEDIGIPGLSNYDPEKVKKVIGTVQQF